MFRRLLSALGRNSRREPRFKVLSLHRVLLEARFGAEVVTVPVTNISTQGIGLVWSRGPVENQLRFDCKLTIDGKEFVTRLEARHQTQALLGCLFVDSTARLAQEIRQFLQVEMHAIKLLHIDEKQLQPDR